MKQIWSGKEAVDLVLKGGYVFSVLTEEFCKGDLAIHNGKIIGLGSYQGKKEIDCEGKYLVPGWIDAHMHIESSMAHPLELAKVLALAGTTTVIADPHEIVNVKGMEAMDFMLDATNKIPITCYFMIPSSVPASDIDTNGAGEILAKDMEPYLSNDRILGLGEVMRYQDVMDGEKHMVEKLRLFQQKHMDGHAPGLSEKQIAAYRYHGIENDHECIDINEALDKLRMGMRILIREGTAAKNADALLQGLVKHSIPYESCMFCTDDKHLADIRREGHISTCIRKAIANGVPYAKAYKMASWYPAMAYGIKNKGGLIPGFDADVIILDDLKEAVIQQIVIRGNVIDKEYLESFAAVQPPESFFHTVFLKDITKEQINVEAKEMNSVIEMQPHQLITKHLYETIPSQNGSFVPNERYNKLCVAERHGKNGLVGVAPLKGFGLKNGAIAASVAHDSHNIIAAGDQDEDILIAINRIHEMQGGYVFVSGGEILGELPLPICGVMSHLPSGEIERRTEELLRISREHGIAKESDPFLNLSFLSLVVIPEIRLTEKGIFSI